MRINTIPKLSQSIVKKCIGWDKGQLGKFGQGQFDERNGTMNALTKVNELCQ